MVIRERRRARNLRRIHISIEGRTGFGRGSDD
jgi:hypothetical protein